MDVSVSHLVSRWLAVPPHSKAENKEQVQVFLLHIGKGDVFPRNPLQISPYLPLATIAPHSRP